VGPLEAVDVIRRAIASSPYAPYSDIYSRVLDGALYYAPSLPSGSAFEFSGHVFVNPAGDPGDLAFLLVASANRAVLRKSWGILTAVYSRAAGLPAVVASELALSAHAFWRAAALVDESALARVRPGAPIPREFPAPFSKLVLRDMVWNLYVKSRSYVVPSNKGHKVVVSKSGDYFPPPWSPGFASLVKEVSETISSTWSTWDWDDSSIAVVNALTERAAFPVGSSELVDVFETSYYVAICTDRCLKTLLSMSYLLPPLDRQPPTAARQVKGARGLLGAVIEKIVSRVLGRGAGAGTGAPREGGLVDQSRAGLGSAASAGRAAKAGESGFSGDMGSSGKGAAAMSARRTSGHVDSGASSRGAGSTSNKGVGMGTVLESSTRGVRREGNREFEDTKDAGHTDLAGTVPHAKSSFDEGAARNARASLHAAGGDSVGSTSKDVVSTISSSPGLFGSAPSNSLAHGRSAANPVIIPSDIAQKIAIALPEIASVVDIRVSEARPVRGGEGGSAFEELLQSWEMWVRSQHHGIAERLEHSLTKTVEGYLRARGAKISKTISDYAMVAWAFPNVRARMRKPGTKYLHGGRRVEPPLLLLLVDVSGSMGLYTELHKKVILSVARKFKLNGYQIFWASTVVGVRPLYDESGAPVVPENIMVKYGGTFIDPALITAKKILKKLRKKNYILVIFSDLEMFITDSGVDLILDLIQNSIRTHLVIPPTSIRHNIAIKYLKKYEEVARKIKVIKADSLVKSAYRSDMP